MAINNFRLTHRKNTPKKDTSSKKPLGCDKCNPLIGHVGKEWTCDKCGSRWPE